MDSYNETQKRKKFPLIWILIILVSFIVWLISQGSIQDQSRETILAYLERVFAEKGNVVLSNLEKKSFEMINWNNAPAQMDFILPKEKYCLAVMDKELFIIERYTKTVISFSNNPPYFLMKDFNNEELLRILLMSRLD